MKHIFYLLFAITFIGCSTPGIPAAKLRKVKANVYAVQPSKASAQVKAAITNYPPEDHLVAPIKPFSNKVSSVSSEPIPDFYVEIPPHSHSGINLILYYLLVTNVGMAYFLRKLWKKVHKKHPPEPTPIPTPIPPVPKPVPPPPTPSPVPVPPPPKTETNS